MESLREKNPKSKKGNVMRKTVTWEDKTGRSLLDNPPKIENGNGIEGLITWTDEHKEETKPDISLKKDRASTADTVRQRDKAPKKDSVPKMDNVPKKDNVLRKAKPSRNVKVSRKDQNLKNNETRTTPRNVVRAGPSKKASKSEPVPPKNARELSGNGEHIGDVFAGMGGGIGGDGRLLLDEMSTDRSGVHGDGAEKVEREEIKTRKITRSKKSDVGGSDGISVDDGLDSSFEGSEERDREGAGEEVAHPSESDDEIDALINRRVETRARIAERVQRVLGTVNPTLESFRNRTSSFDDDDMRATSGISLQDIPHNSSIRLTREEAQAVKDSIRPPQASRMPAGRGGPMHSNAESSGSIRVAESGRIGEWSNARAPSEDLIMPRGPFYGPTMARPRNALPERAPEGEMRMPSFSSVARQVSEERFFHQREESEDSEGSDFITDVVSEYEFDLPGPSNAPPPPRKVAPRKRRIHPMMATMNRRYGRRASSFDITIIGSQTIPASQTHDPFESCRKAKGPRSNNSYSIDTRSAAEYVEEPRTIRDPRMDYDLALKLRMNMRSVGRYMGTIEDESDEEDSNGLLRNGGGRRYSYVEADPTTTLAAILGSSAVPKSVMQHEGFGCALNLERELLKVLPTNVRHMHYLFIWRPLAQMWSNILPRFLGCPTVDLGMGIGPELRNLLLYSCCVGPLPVGARELTEKEAAAVRFARMSSSFPHRISIESRRLMDRLFGGEKMQQIGFVLAIGGFWNTVMSLLGLDTLQDDPDMIRKARESINSILPVSGSSKVLSKKKKGLLQKLRFPVKTLAYSRQISRLDSVWMDTYPKSWRKVQEMLKSVMGFIPEYLMKIKSIDQRHTLTCVIEQTLLTENKTNGVSLPFKHMMMYVLAVAAENPILAAHSAYLSSRFGAGIDQLVRATNRGLLYKLRKALVDFETRSAKGDNTPPTNTTMQALTLFTRQELSLLLLAHSAATTSRRSSLEKSGGIHAVGKMTVTSKETEALRSDFIPEGIMEAVGVLGAFSMLQRFTAVFRYRAGALEMQVRQFVQGPIGFELSLSKVGQRKPSRMDSDFGNRSMSSRRLASYLPRRMMTK